MTITIYVPPSEKPLIKSAKKLAKIHKISISKITVDAIKAFVESKRV